MLTSIIASVLAFGALTYQPAPADDGHELTQLWKRYEVAEAGDQPVTQCKILAEIKEKAVAGHYIVDFYDAATKYVDVSLQRNWKLRDSLYTALKKEIADFGEPFLEYKRMNRYDYPSADELWNYASGKLDKIGMHRTPALWSGYLDSGLLEFVKDDAEYVLWEILGKKNVDYDYPDRYPVYVTLQNKLDGSYPLAPYLEYITAYRKFNPEKQKAALEEHMAKYDGKAIALFSRQALLKIEYGELQKKNNASSSDYEAIYEKAKAFEKARGKFKGDEAKVASSCTFAEGLIDTLTAKSLEVRTGQGKARIFFRNMDKATLEVTLFTGNKVLYSTEVKNPVKSFYVRDSVDVDVPAFEDGSYEFKVKGGKDVEDSTFYDQFRLSTAIQWDAAGQKIYVAEYNSGKPVPRVTLFLKKQGSVVATETLKLSGVFTLLPSKITRALKNSPKTYFELVAETFDADGVAMRSNPVTISYYNKPEFETYDSDDERGMRANLYKDQGAYRPGDTLRFKTIVFKGSIEDKLSVIANRSIEVRLFDTEYKLVGQLKLKTNAFGSASGEFELPTDRRGGYFNLGVYTGKDGCIGSEHVRVDEYQLPTFSLSFDRRNELFLPGEDIPVSG